MEAIATGRTGRRPACQKATRSSKYRAEQYWDIPGVFSLSDSALNWCFPECLILFHSGLPRGAITKSRMTEWP
ncbi:MAG: hypothetical protein NTY19_11600, partial [Planctomycetota bacterium]|nr:hypothetical protein [Planctomycetota bacterium]